MPTRVEGSFNDPQRNQATAIQVTTSPTPSPAAPATHISWDLSNPLHRLRRPNQTRVKTKCGRRAPLDRINDSAPTCADCTTAMRAAAVELLASIREPRFERGCRCAAGRLGRPRLEDPLMRGLALLSERSTHLHSASGDHFVHRGPGPRGSKR